MARPPLPPESIDEIARRLRLMISAFDIPPSKLADGAGVGRSTLSNWLAGKGRPSLDEAMKIARHLQITLDYIYFGKMDGLPLDKAQKLMSAAQEAA